MKWSHIDWTLKVTSIILITLMATLKLPKYKYILQVSLFFKTTVNMVMGLCELLFLLLVYTNLFWFDCETSIFLLM